MEQLKETVIVVAAFCVIVGVAFYVWTHADWGCVDLYFWKTCGVVTHK